jgi:hypothetical protein
VAALVTATRRTSSLSHTAYDSSLSHTAYDSSLYQTAYVSAYQHANILVSGMACVRATE